TSTPMTWGVRLRLITSAITSTKSFFQCVIYDGNTTDSRLIGIEYIVSERIFKSLPEDEKPLWHSHRHETTSGELVMPGIPETVEHTAIATLVNTYGKTWHGRLTAIQPCQLESRNS